MSPSRTDDATRLVLGGLALLAGGLVLLVVAFLLHGAWPAITSGRLGQFFTDTTWRPGSARDPRFGLTPMLVASFLVTLLSIVIAGPLGVAGAVFDRFYLPAPFRAWHVRLWELLAGVPSVVFGFWGLMVLVPAINRIQPPGQSLLAAGIVLGLMILPTVALTSLGALRAVPESQLLAAAGLGIGRARTILEIALPAARSGIGSGLLLAVARAVGETMAVVMVCGNIAKFPTSLFDPVRPVTATIALEMGYASSDHKSLLHAAGLMLMLVTAALAGWLAFRKSRPES